MNNGIRESIFSGFGVVIPMAEVQHIEKKFHDCDMADGAKKGDLMGVSVITSMTKWNFEHDCWENSIWLSKELATEFLKAWCDYRYDAENLQELGAKP
jgi:hypothetical protein